MPAIAAALYELYLRWRGGWERGWARYGVCWRAGAHQRCRNQKRSHVAGAGWLAAGVCRVRGTPVATGTYSSVLSSLGFLRSRSAIGAVTESGRVMRGMSAICRTGARRRGARRGDATNAVAVLEQRATARKARENILTCEEV